MEKSALDMEKIEAMLLNIFMQMDRQSIAEIASLDDFAGLQNTILDTLGIPPESLSTGQLEEFRSRIKVLVKLATNM